MILRRHEAENCGRERGAAEQDALNADHFRAELEYAQSGSAGSTRLVVQRRNAAPRRAAGGP